jgi:LysR family glycine cleavage system transcriptional activator
MQVSNHSPLPLQEAEAITLADNELPLRAIRIFEAFVEQGSIAGSAAELNITPSAVSHQLRLLETFLSTTLTERRGRTLVLNEAGKNYYLSIHKAFSMLREATLNIQEKPVSQRVVVAVISLFGTGWLNRHLSDFLARHPDINVQVVYAHHENYLCDGADLSVRYGTGNWRGYRSIKLISGNVVPVCSASFLRRYGQIKTPADLLRVPLVHDTDFSSWSRWLSQFGVQLHNEPTGTLYEDGQLTVSAVICGLGVGLLRKPLIQAELDSGSLVQLFDDSLETGSDYYLCVRHDDVLPEATEKLAAWLVGTTR